MFTAAGVSLFVAFWSAWFMDQIRFYYLPAEHWKRALCGWLFLLSMVVLAVSGPYSLTVLINGGSCPCGPR